MVRSQNIDQSLDDVIRNNKSNFRRGGGSYVRGYRRARSYGQPYYNPRRSYYGGFDNRNRSYGGGFRRSNYNNNRNIGGGYRGRNFNYVSPNSGIKLVTNPNITKMYVSNLEFGSVTQGDMRELFGSLGKLKHVALHYDKNGRSQGSCEIIFERKGDALNAYNQYNGVPLDGRPMTLELMGEPAPIQNEPRERKSNFNNNNKDKADEAKPEKTAEDLDKELDAYLTKGAEAKKSSK